MPDSIQYAATYSSRFAELKCLLLCMSSAMDLATYSAVVN
jgi:hypothetical protein